MTQSASLNTAPAGEAPGGDETMQDADPLDAETEDSLDAETEEVGLC